MTHTSASVRWDTCWIQIRKHAHVRTQTMEFLGKTKFYGCKCLIITSHLRLYDFDVCSQMWECLFSGSDTCVHGHDCQQICVSTDNSYICKCREGYVLNADKKTCSRKNLDLSNRISPQSHFCFLHWNWKKHIVWIVWLNCIGKHSLV